jgi:hypothetical protein
MVPVETPPGQVPETLSLRAGYGATPSYLTDPLTITFLRERLAGAQKPIKPVVVDERLVPTKHQRSVAHAG